MRFSSILSAALLISTLLLGTALAQSQTADQLSTPTIIDQYNPVTDERLLNPEPENWLMYKGNYSMWGNTTLDQITPDNVTDLVPVWAFSTGQTNGHESPPIVNDGIMFATGAYNTLFALEAKTGKLIWQYQRQLPQDVYAMVCCDVVNRGVALYKDKVYMATLDSHLLAFDAVSGDIVWDVTVEDYLTAATMTLAPLIAKGKVMVGISGGEYGVRGFVAAYDADTGDRVWKTYTTAGPGEPGHDTWPGDTWQTGGASIWVTGSYDPDTNISYWGTGNASPWMGDLRPGDNLYVSSVVGIDVDSGDIRSHYQYNPNDSWDYDEISDQVLVDVNRDGKEMKGLIHAGRNGYFYLLDRGNDLKFEYAIPYSKSALTITGFDEDGRPQVPEDRKPAVGKTVYTCPTVQGAVNWEGLSYDPNTGHAYLPTTEWCMEIGGKEKPEYRAGQSYTGGSITGKPPRDIDMTGALQAIDVATGEVLWRTEQKLGVRSPILTTKSGLVFIGDVASREFRAYSAEDGKELWHFTTNSAVVGVPTSFEIDGVQYIAVEAGAGGNAISDVKEAAEAYGIPYTETQGGVVWVFALKDQLGSSQPSSASNNQQGAGGGGQ